MSTNPPYGFTCLTCPLGQMHSTDFKQRICHGAPPSDNIIGQAKNGDMIRIASYPVVDQSGWCLQHPEIAIRWGEELARRMRARDEGKTPSGIITTEGKA